MWMKENGHYDPTSDRVLFAEITMHQWEGDKTSGRWSSDLSHDFFEWGSLTHFPDTDIAIVDDIDYCIDMANDWMNRTGDYADDDSTEERSVLVEKKEMFDVWFEGGESRGNANILNLVDVPMDVNDGQAPVNYMLCRLEIEDEDGCPEEVELYAEWYSEYDDPEDAGYEELKEAILEQADEYGIPHDKLHFFYDSWSIVTNN